MLEKINNNNNAKKKKIKVQSKFKPDPTCKFEARLHLKEF